MSFNYAYLHGFATGPDSEKAVALSDRFADAGLELHRPDLNNPSFNELTYTGMIEGIEQLDERVGNDRPWRFIASSMGGFAAARWAELNPHRVDRLLLLSPGFNMRTRWPELLGETGMEEWEDEGSFLFFGPEGSLQPVHWELFDDACRNHPAHPEVPCETLIIHGREDRIVPVNYSRDYAAEHEHVGFLEIEDGDHTLTESLDMITRRAFEVFEVDEEMSMAV